ncbi:hypothetical protein NPIL_18351 [Nephila pilipes]|uniref:Uncharacterized protein n=1 Tax=Nephila pilipes TaxID=299642 RepID=A0A8X6TFH9_NEPPI|nr:hypothetical protein NPIL_18351 [Nephila pilipes]
MSQKGGRAPKKHKSSGLVTLTKNYQKQIRTDATQSTNPRDVSKGNRTVCNTAPDFGKTKSFSSQEQDRTERSVARAGMRSQMGNRRPSFEEKKMVGHKKKNKR